jgi:hypothetical protein
MVDREISHSARVKRLTSNPTTGTLPERCIPSEGSGEQFYQEKLLSFRHTNLLLTNVAKIVDLFLRHSKFKFL